MENNYQNAINGALNELKTTKTIVSAIKVSNCLLEYMGIETQGVDDISMSRLRLPNAERYDRWFEPHPHFRGSRACFELTSRESILEAKFFSLQKKSRLFIAGSVSFTPNFEDHDYTRNDPAMKVGIDFFLAPEKDSVTVVLSNKGSLRLVELSGRLTNTQHEIFEYWHNIALTEDKNKLHTSIWESFKLSSLNRKFYVGISNSFVTLTQHLINNGVEEQLANQFANRLHGRLLFLWFLRKKHIINEEKNYFDIRDNDDAEYYDKTLSTLFFNVLNNESHKDIDTETPYLNGGLFDQKSDGVYWNTHKPAFPQGFFHALYEHFNSFNFTTDESTPEYEQIAIDPEMLGRIFESFLATLKTETGTQAKKANGAFYTPREIVSYMSRESLRQYLYSALEAGDIQKKSIDDLLDRSDNEWALAGTNSKRDTVTKEDRDHIKTALLNIRVLDPAVGSGAFPMGILHKMLSVYERLGPNHDPYETKISILKNNIYGVDIDPTAIEICRLRAWLSIIVDVKDVKKIKPLPNLDFKFVCANSLVRLEKTIEGTLGTNYDLKNQLIDIRDLYYATSSKTKKNKLQKDYLKLTHRHQTALFDTEETSQLKSYQPFTNGQSASFYDPELMHGVKIFDLFVGNPPYGASLKGEYRKTVIKHLGRVPDYEIYYYFLELAKKLLVTNGINSYIIPNTYIFNVFAAEYRKKLLDDWKVEVLIDCTAFKLFESATVFNTIHVFKKSNNGELVGYKNTMGAKKFEDLLSRETQYISKNDLLANNTNWGLAFKLLPETIKLTIKIRNTGVKVSDMFPEISQGLIAYDKYTGQDEDIIKNRSLHHQEKNNELSREWLWGEDITPYSVVWNGKEYVDYGPKIANPRQPKYFKGKRILVREITNPKIYAAITETEFYHDPAIIVILDNQKDTLLLLAVLNSKTATFYHFNNSPKATKGAFPKILVKDIKDFPFPSIDTSDKKISIEKIESLINIIVNKKREDPNTDTYNIENQIDKLIYDLYGLSSSEIGVIEDYISNNQ